MWVGGLAFRQRALRMVFPESRHQKSAKQKEKNDGN
jgi:hypothetical protein